MFSFWHVKYAVMYTVIFCFCYLKWMRSCAFMNDVTSNRKTHIIRMNDEHFNRFVNKNVSYYMCNNRYRPHSQESDQIHKFSSRKEDENPSLILMLRLIDTFAHMLSTLTHKLKQKRMNRDKKIKSCQETNRCFLVNNWKWVVAFD